MDESGFRLLVEKACLLADVTSCRLYLRAPGGEALERCIVIGRTTGSKAAPAEAQFRDALAGRTAVAVSASGSTTVHLALSGADGTGARGLAVLQTARADLLDSRLGALRELLGAALAARDAGRALAQQHDELTKRHACAVHAATVEARLSPLVPAGGGLSSILQACTELTGKTLALYGTRGQLLASSSDEGASQVRVPRLPDLLAHAGPHGRTGRRPVMVSADPPRGLPRRHLLVPVLGGDLPVAWLVVVEHPSAIRPGDEVVAVRAARHLAGELDIQRRLSLGAWNARSALTRQLLHRSSDPDDLRLAGEYLGVDVTARRVLVYVLDPRAGSAGRLEEEVLAGEVSRLLRVEVLATRGSEGVMLLVEAPADVSPVAMVNRVKEAVRDACLELDRELIVGVSAVTEPTGLPRAYRAAREVALCVDRFTEKAQVRVLAVDDLGPARLFVANSDVASVRAYVDDILGPLLAGGLHTADLIVTLHCYFDASRSVRASSAQLGVHENTVRLRLARVRAVTGLDVLGDASDQLSVQTALVVLRLQGHPALPALGDRTEDRQREQTA